MLLVFVEVQTWDGEMIPRQLECPNFDLTGVIENASEKDPRKKGERSVITSRPIWENEVIFLAIVSRVIRACFVLLHS